MRMSTSSPEDVIDALDELDQCVDILRTVYLSMLSKAWDREDFDAVGNVVNFTAMRMDDARAVIRDAQKKK